MIEYKDMIAKAKFYKKQVMQSFIKKGYYPSNEEITNALNDIDMRTALLETYMSREGSLFNTKEINYMFECIFKDLNILYEILQDILINEYNRFKLDIEAQLIELETKANELKKRMNEEINSTVFGTTLFFKSNNWNTVTTDDTTVVDLGELKLLQGSRIASFATINNITPDSVYFNFEAEDTTKSFNVLPYNYNEDIYKVPGILDTNRYELNLNGRLIVNDNITITLSEVNTNNDYKILGGASLMFITDKSTNQKTLVDFASNNRPYYADKDCYIEFYLLDNSSITYDFNKKPNHTNFPLNNGIISSSDTITKIFIDAPAGFVCRFGIEKGEVWASCEDGIPIDNKNLMYSGDWSLRDFQILEFIKTKTTNYKVKMILKSNEDIVKNIENVYIKEID